MICASGPVADDEDAAQAVAGLAFGEVEDGARRPATARADSSPMSSRAFLV